MTWWLGMLFVLGSGIALWNWKFKPSPALLVARECCSKILVHHENDWAEVVIGRPDANHKGDVILCIEPKQKTDSWSTKWEILDEAGRAIPYERNMIGVTVTEKYGTLKLHFGYVAFELTFPADKKPRSIVVKVTGKYLNAATNWYDRYEHLDVPCKLD